MRLVNCFFPTLFCFVATSVFAQNFGPSVYSRLGIGDLADGSFSRNQGMGGAGVATSHNYQLNSLNPAALSALKYTNFEFGIAAKSNVLRSNDDSQKGSSAAIQYISLAMPLHKRFVTQFCARPFSTVNYQDNFQSNVGEKTYQITYTGSGGLSEFFLNNAYNYHDWLSIGLNTGIILGQSTYDLTQLDSYNAKYVTTKQVNEKVLKLSPGILITREIKSLKKSIYLVSKDSLHKDSIVLKGTTMPISPKSWFYGIGLTGSFYNTLSANQDQYQNEARYTYYTTSSGSYYDYIPYKNDTVQTGTVSGFKLPSSVKLGFSLYKPNKIVLALDYTMSDWSNFSTNELNSTFRKQQVVAFGSEYIPDYNSTKFYKRVAYRAGLNYNMLPYQVEGQNINQIQANVGAGFLLPRAGVNLNMNLAYGQRGTTASNLVQENYWLLSVGIIANSKWFVRRKHE